MALWVKADGTTAIVAGTGSNGEVVWDQIKEAVGGGYLEMVRCDPAATGGFDHFYCDEEGKLKNLPRNNRATKLSTLTQPWDVVCGDVLFCKTYGEESR